MLTNSIYLSIPPKNYPRLSHTKFSGDITYDQNASRLLEGRLKGKLEQMNGEYDSGNDWKITATMAKNPRAQKSRFTKYALQVGDEVVAAGKNGGFAELSKAIESYFKF